MEGEGDEVKPKQAFTKDSSLLDSVIQHFFSLFLGPEEVKLPVVMPI